MQCLRKAGVGLLRLWQKINVFSLYLRGLTPESDTEARLVSGEIWAQFCDTIKAAGASMLAGDPPIDGFNQAEGYRYLSRLLRVSLENFVECSDPGFPKLVALANGNRAAPVKIGSDNPDNLYQNAILSSEYVYHVEGTRGTVHYLGLGVQSGSYGKAGGLLTVDYKEAADFGCPKDLDAPEKILRFFISTEAMKPPECKRKRCPVPWLCMVENPTEHVFIVRQTFNDCSTEFPAKLAISAIGGHQPAPITPQSLEDGLQTAGLFVAGASMMFSMWAKSFKKHVNELPLFDQEKSNRAGGDPNIRYYHSYWSLGPEEALVIDADPPACDTWNFQLNNHWMESLDYRYYTIHTNKHLATYRPNGSVTVIVAHEDPKLPGVTWVNTVRHSCGTMCWRWIKPEHDPCPPPRPRVVNLKEYMHREVCTDATQGLRRRASSTGESTKKRGRSSNKRPPRRVARK